MTVLLKALAPELILTAIACALMLLGVSPKAASRRAAAWIALAAVATLFFVQLFQQSPDHTLVDPQGSVRVFTFANYIKMLATGVGVLLVLLAWPTDRDATGNSALNFGTESGE